jgi:hypothetical protein
MSVKWAWPFLLQKAVFGHKENQLIQVQVRMVEILMIQVIFLKIEAN